MSNQKTNSVLVFVAVLVAAIIVIYAIMSNKPKTQPPVDGTVPAEAEVDPADGEGTDTGTPPEDDITRIDQTTDTTHGEVPAGGEADDQTGEEPAATPEEEAPAAPSTLIEAAQAGDHAGHLDDLIGRSEDSRGVFEPGRESPGALLHPLLDGPRQGTDLVVRRRPRGAPDDVLA